MKNSVKNLFNRLTKQNFILAISVFVFHYLLRLYESYEFELFQISQKSLQTFGGDISVNLGFSEVMKSGDFNFFTTYREISIIFSYLIIAVYFNDYKKLSHIGWQRIHLSIQIIIPLVLALYFTLSDIYDPTQARYLNNTRAFILHFIVVLGWIEVVVLLLGQLVIWIREGFSAKT